MLNQQSTEKMRKALRKVHICGVVEFDTEYSFIVIKCPICGKIHAVRVTFKERDELEKGEKLIQDILPNRTEFEKDQLILGFCQHCWEDFYQTKAEMSIW